MKKLGLGFSAALFCLSTPLAYAFDPPQHVKLTELAAESSGVHFTPTEIRWMEEGAKGEDTDIRLAWPRIFNWHFFPDSYYPTGFFNPARRDHEMKLGKQMNYHAERRIDKINVKLAAAIAAAHNAMESQPAICGFSHSATRDNSECKLQPVFELIGRGAHFIQDASVPSHVVPLYHGPYMKEQARGVERHGFSPLDPIRFLKLSDPVDSAMITIENQVLPQDIDSVAPAAGGSKLAPIIKANIHGVLDLMTHALVPPAVGPVLEGKIRGVDVGDYEHLLKLPWFYFFRAPADGEFFGSFAVDAKGTQLFNPLAKERENQWACVLRADLPPADELLSHLISGSRFVALHGRAALDPAKASDSSVAGGSRHAPDVSVVKAEEMVLAPCGEACAGAAVAGEEVATADPAALGVHPAAGEVPYPAVPDLPAVAPPAAHSAQVIASTKTCLYVPSVLVRKVFINNIHNRAVLSTVAFMRHEISKLAPDHVVPHSHAPVAPASAEPVREGAAAGGSGSGAGAGHAGPGH